MATLPFFTLELSQDGRERILDLVHYGRRDIPPIDVLRQYTNTKGIIMNKTGCSEEFFVELFKDVLPTMPALQRIIICSDSVTLKVHQLCAALICASSSLTMVIMRSYLSLDTTSIKIIYVRALRHQPRFSGPITLVFQFEQDPADNLFRLEELANQASPTMLEYCHEAARLAQEKPLSPTRH